MKSFSQLFFLCLATLVIFIVSSCTTAKQITYFDNVADTSFSGKPAKEIVVQSNDILSITISSLNKDASEIFNAANNSAALPNQPLVGGYLVNTEGFIQLPVLGAIKAAGLTKEQLKNAITNLILEKKLLIDPLVSIRQINFRVTVLGEVLHPSTIPVPSERISMLEALGLAGDLTIFGKRENVLLIREDNSGKKQLRRVNLTSKNFFLSPYYYLQPNDVIYVEPGRVKISSASATKQWVPVIISSISIISLLIYRLTRN